MTFADVVRAAPAAIADVAKSMGVVRDLMCDFASEATRFEKAMADLTRSINQDLYGPPEVTRTVAEE